MRLLFLVLVLVVCFACGGVSAHYGGTYPQAPGMIVGGLNIPQTGHIGPASYACSTIVDNWNIANEHRLGAVAIALVGGQAHGYYALSGLNYNTAPANIPFQNPVVNPLVNVGAVHAWHHATITAIETGNVATSIHNAFNGGRKCFGQSVAEATCQSVADGTITRTFHPSNTPEVGYRGGQCALSKVLHFMAAAGVLPAQIICASEKTPDGWGQGRNVNTEALVQYGNNDRVHSCVTCQNYIPLLLTSCNVPAPLHGTSRGNCPAVMMDGEACDINCGANLRVGGGVGGQTTCVNGVLSEQFCRRPCAVPAAPAAHHNAAPAGQCAAGGQLAHGASCSYACDAHYQANPQQVTCNDGGVIAPQVCVGVTLPCIVPAAPAANLGAGPHTCVPGAPLAHGASCTYNCAGALLPPTGNVCTNGQINVGGAPQACAAAPARSWASLLKFKQRKSHQQDDSADEDGVLQPL